MALHRDGTLVARYAYNAFGERVKKTVYSPEGTPRVTYFLYDGSTLVAEADGEGSVTAHYVYLPDGHPAAKLEGREIYAIHTDHRGAPRLASDEAGRIVWRASYAPFGRAQVAHAAIALPLRLPGQYADAESGTHYNYHRHYDPETGRYLTSDPIGLLAGVNTYAYVDGDPLGTIDPLGLAGEALVIGTGGVVAGSSVALWLATVAQVGAAAAGAAVLTGGGIVVVALAVYFYSEYAARSEGEAETAFAAEFGGKPSAEDYRALHGELYAYAPWLEVADPSIWDGGWNSYFEMARQLEDAQRTYVADYEAVYGVDGTCASVDRRTMYEAAVAAVAAADAAPEAEEVEEVEAPVTTTGSPNPPPECDEAGRQIREALYDNKHSRSDSETGRPSGGHGYLRRMLEQICGQEGPDSDGWLAHQENLVGERNNLERARNVMTEHSCDITQHVSRRDRQLMQMIENRAGWQPDSMPWLGRSHPQCAGWESISQGEDNQRLIQKLLDLAGGSI